MNPVVGAGVGAPGALRVTGGAGGTDARLEDLDAVAAALAERALACHVGVLGVGALAASPVLLGSALIDLPGAWGAERELAAAAAALAQLGAAVGGVGAAVAGAAASYRAVDAGTAAAWVAARTALVEALDRPLLGVVIGGAVVIGAASVVAGGAAGVRELRRSGWTGQGPAAGPAAGGRAGWPEDWTDGAGWAGWSGAGVGAGGWPGAAAWDAARRVGAATAVELTQGALARLVAAVPPDLREHVVEEGIAATGVPAPVLAAGLLAVGAPLGAWGSSTASVRPTGPPVTTTAAAGTGDLLRRVHRLSPKEGAAPGSVRVDRLAGPGREPVAVVHLPSTQQWFPTRGANPVDGETNVRSVAGQRTAVTDGVVKAMRAAGVSRAEPVMLVGYSQGGLTAAQLAADPRFRAEFTPRAVLAAGSPIAHAEVPDDVTVLALEHDGDYVHGLDGAENPDGASWTTVEAPSGGSAHSAPAYAATADLVDASDHRSLAAWRQDAAPFLADSSVPGGGATVTSTTWVLTRGP